MPKNWVDYKEIKAKVTMQMVLEHYGHWDKMKKSGQNLVSVCPIHQGTNNRQFSVNEEKNIWRCFGDCQDGGNVLDFVAKMEDVDIRKAALLLKGWFFTDPGKMNAHSVQKDEKAKGKDRGEARKAVKNDSAKPPQEAPENKPLKFKLQNLDHGYSWFEEKGIAPETAKFFGAGYFGGRGMMNGRVAIPIQDHAGELVGYCGRAVTDDQAREEGKYLLPPNFHKSLVVYNLFRQEPGPKALVLVESYLSVWKLHQAGIGRVCALQGASISKEQAEAILGLLGPGGRILFMFDADESGERCTEACFKALGKDLWCRAVDFSHLGKKPHQLEEGIIKEVLK